jgi:hypothetical protein
MRIVLKQVSEEVDRYQWLRDQRFPDGFEPLEDIRKDKSIRRELWNILNTDAAAEVKEIQWIMYLEEKRESLLITSEEFERLKSWRIDWRGRRINDNNV